VHVDPVAGPERDAAWQPEEEAAIHWRVGIGGELTQHDLLAILARARVIDRDPAQLDLARADQAHDAPGTGGERHRPSADDAERRSADAGRGEHGQHRHAAARGGEEGAGRGGDRRSCRERSADLRPAELGQEDAGGKARDGSERQERGRRHRVGRVSRPSRAR
jgi:hypothetical protein